MVLLQVSVVDGTLDELSPQQVISWARIQFVHLEEVSLELQQWNFKATEKKPNALTNLLQRQEDNPWPCNKKQLMVQVGSNASVSTVMAYIRGHRIQDILQPTDVMDNVQVAMSIPLTLKQSWADRFIFEVESTVSQSDLQILLNMGMPVVTMDLDDPVHVEFSMQDVPLPPRSSSPPPPPPPCHMIVTQMEIYHDGENCVIPNCEMKTNEDGSWVFQQGGTKKIPQIKSGKGRHIQFEILQEKLLRRVLECAEGPDSARSKDLTSLKWYWNFVLSFDRKGTEMWCPPPRVKQDMLNCGVTIPDPGDKDGAVDHKLKELLWKAQWRWSKWDAAEKTGLLCVLIAGDCDYSDVIREIRRSGVEVCIVYSKNSPARSTFLRHVDKNMVVDEWSHIVESSRKRQEENEGAKMTVPVSPAIMKFLDVMNEKPQLEARLQQIHPDISLNYGTDCLQLAVKPDGSVRQDKVTEALKVIKDLRDDICHGEPVEVMGLTVNQLKKDLTLKNLAQLNQVSVHIPINRSQGFKEAEVVPLKFNQLFVQSQHEEKWIKDTILRQCKVSIFSVQEVRGQRVVVLDLKGNVQQAKKCLLSLKWKDPVFSTTSASKTQLQMKHPVSWGRSEVEAFQRRRGLKFEFQAEAKVCKNKNFASRVVTCAPSLRARIFESAEKEVSFTDWVNKTGGTSTGVKSSGQDGARSIAYVAYRKGNDDGRNQVENYIKSLGVETDGVFLLPGPKKHFAAESDLLRSTWNGIAKYLRNLGVQDARKDDNGTHLVAVLVGKASEVQKAKAWLKHKVDKIQALHSENFNVQKFEHWDASVRSFVSSLLKRYRAAGSSADVGEASPTSEAETEISEGCFAGFSVSNGVVKLVCFEEDLEEVRELVPEINAFCGAYEEQWWNLPEFPSERKDQLNKLFWAEDFLSKLRQTYNLSKDPTWWKNPKTYEWYLQLCGRNEDVRSAVESLSNQCKPEEVLEFDVPADEILLKVLRSSKDKFQKVQDAVKKGCSGSEVYCQSEKVLVKCRSSSRQEAQKLVQRHLKTLANELQSIDLQLSDFQLDFLTDSEGEKILRKSVQKYAVHSDWRADNQITLLSQYRLPNGASVELRCGDILSNALGITGLVNSVNSQLLATQVGGIAGAIKERGGPKLVEECQQILMDRLQLNITDVVVTGSHRLSAAGFSKIFHVRAPEYTGTSDNALQMETSVMKTLALVGEHGLDSVVFPVVGAGIFQWQSDKASLFASILSAIATWGKQGGSTLKRIVVMDINTDLMKELATAMSNFDDQDVNEILQRQEPVFEAPQYPAHLWKYDCTNAGQGWVAYDYDQAFQLDAAHAAGESVVQLSGDRFAKPSDSTHIEEGNTVATYEVDFRRCGDEYCATQFNKKSRWPRKVVKEPLSSVQEALEKLPMYKENYNQRFLAYEEARKVWEANKTSGVALLERGTTFYPGDKVQLRGLEKAPQHNGKSGILSQQVPSSAGGEMRWRVQCADGMLDVKEANIVKTSSDPEPPMPPKLLRSSSRRIFSQVFEDRVAQGALRLVGFGKPTVQKAHDFVLTQLAASEAQTEAVEIKLHSGETFQEALDNFEDFLARRALKVLVEPQEPKLVLKVLGKSNLPSALNALRAWDGERALRVIDQLLQANKVQFPDEWGDINADNEPEFQEVSPDSSEYQKVVDLMCDETGLGTRQNVWHRQILKVERVVNPILWASYSNFCRNLKNNPRNKDIGANEVWVKHGTAQADPVDICKSELGIDKNYSRENGNFYGKALYTAESAAYVDPGYCYVNGGVGQILLCKFAAGTICQMDQRCSTLAKAPDGHDCVRGPVRGDLQAFMAYLNFQVYPFYLVSFQV